MQLVVKQSKVKETKMKRTKKVQTMTTRAGTKRITLAPTLNSEYFLLSMQHTSGGAFYDWYLTKDDVESLAQMLGSVLTPAKKLDCYRR
jgi:hypothetical protein